MSTLASDSRLLRGFVRWASDKPASATRLQILEQQLPGEEESVEEDEAHRRGLPDAWIHDGDSWALIIESKIGASLEKDQLDRHRRVAERRGFSNIQLLALVTGRPKRLVLDGLRIVEWSELYTWLQQEGDSDWAHHLTNYMEVLERKLVADQYLREGTLTVFTGIPFGKDYPYNYHEAKRLLRLALAQLRLRRDLKRELGMDPLGGGRPAITGREGTTVWDFLPLAHAKGAKNFTEFPHLTITIQHDRVLAAVTVPNGIRRQLRRNLLASGKEGFVDLLERIHDNFGKLLGDVEGVAPWVEIHQRHYPSQRAEPIVDARLQFDLRTAFKGPKRWSKPVKRQAQWIDAVYQALSKKRSNLQFSVGGAFLYERCPAVRSPEILNHVANVWLACKPLIRRAIG
jgi:hypothetical protein